MPRNKGRRIGSPKTLATPSAAWQPHPQEAGALIQSWVGLWHSVLPGPLMRIVVVWRPPREAPRGPKVPKPLGAANLWKPSSTPMGPCLSTPRWAPMKIAGPWKLLCVTAMPIMA